MSAKTQATADKSEAHWQQIQSDELRAEWAEADARDAVDFASNAIDEATYAMLDAILARKDMSVLAEEYSERSS